jgi:hypothetical protein
MISGADQFTKLYVPTAVISSANLIVSPFANLFHSGTLGYAIDDTLG